MRRVVLWLSLVCAWPLSAADYNQYDAELVKTYSMGDGFAEFGVDAYRAEEPDPPAIGFDAAGNLFASDAPRERLVVGDRSLELREEHHDVYSGNTLFLEINEHGIGNHHYMAEFSWVGPDYRNRFIVSYELGRFRPVRNSSLLWGEVVFAYLRDGSLISVAEPGLDWKENEEKTQGDAQTRALLHEPDRYATGGLTVDREGRLFLKGEIATRSYEVFYWWCAEQGNGAVRRTGNAADLGWNPELSVHTAFYLGSDSNGNIYWRDSLSTLVFDKHGALIEICLPASRSFVQAVHPSGDLYFFLYSAREMSLTRIRNVWDPTARELWEAQVIASTGDGIRSAEVTAGPLRVRRAAGPMGAIAGELAKGCGSARSGSGIRSRRPN